jgi:predicted alpha-1,6-mannanase (GH76 family)
MGWAERARASTDVLLEQYWDPRPGLFRTMPARSARRFMPGRPRTWHYWWQAHALDALVDAASTGDARAVDLVPRHLRGIVARNGGDITGNDYYDDLAWMGLATLRAHLIGLADARVPLSLSRAVMRGRDLNLGGFHWRVGSGFTNVAASATSAMLLADTSDLAADPGLRDVAQATAEWIHAHLVTAQGLVRDGVRIREGVPVRQATLWSYNVGLVAGLDVVLASRADPGTAGLLLARAARVVRAGTGALRVGTDGTDRVGGRDAAPQGAARPEPARPESVWRDEAGPDGHLFRGILARYAADLVLADPSRTRDIAADVLVQAHAVWDARDDHGRHPASWVRHESGTPSLAAHLSGLSTLTSAARLERAGLC